MNLIKKAFILILYFLFSNAFAYSQIDTVMLLKKINKRHTIFKNVYVEFITSNYLDSNLSIKKKVWYDKTKACLRSENYRIEDLQIESICILNEKQTYNINPSQKRSDLYSFNLLKNEDLEDYYTQLEMDHLPSFMIKEGDIDSMINDLMQEIRSKENVFFETINDITINGITCFGFKITDFDKNNGFIPDKTGKGNEKYADKTVETTYLSKKDSTILLRITKYIYTNPASEKDSYEQIFSYEFENKKNTNMHLYTINTDTLRNYFQTHTKFNGNNLQTELSDFSIKKAPDFYGTTSDIKEFKLNEIKSKYILLGFWSTDCDECLTQMDALNEQYIELKNSGLTFIAVNSKETLEKNISIFITERNYNFQVVFSKRAGKLYLTNSEPFYVLIDEKNNIKDLFYELNQEIVDKIVKKLK
jgi:peroxiredoxin